jgi:S-adenosylmethionine:tRNA ribosyltransferase-isomerase
LHFTKDVLKKLKKKNISTAFVTLHVGAGTFKPVKAVEMKDHDMHAEWMHVSIDFVQQLMNNIEKNSIIAVGTTSLRTLETLYWIGLKIHLRQSADEQLTVKQWEVYELEATISAKQSLQILWQWMKENNVKNLITKTQIIIAPSYPFKIVNALITNFHQPKSTLLLLVAAFIGEDWKKVYNYAQNNQFRFLSYGDGSLLWRKDEASIVGHSHCQAS